MAKDPVTAFAPAGILDSMAEQTRRPDLAVPDEGMKRRNAEWLERSRRLWQQMAKENPNDPYYQIQAKRFEDFMSRSESQPQLPPQDPKAPPKEDPFPPPERVDYFMRERNRQFEKRQESLQWGVVQQPLSLKASPEEGLSVLQGHLRLARQQLQSNPNDPWYQSQVHRLEQYSEKLLGCPCPPNVLPFQDPKSPPPQKEPSSQGEPQWRLLLPGERLLLPDEMVDYFIREYMRDHNLPPKESQPESPSQPSPRPPSPALATQPPPIQFLTPRFSQSPPPGPPPPPNDSPADVWESTPTCEQKPPSPLSSVSYRGMAEGDVGQPARPHLADFSLTDVLVQQIEAAEATRFSWDRFVENLGCLGQAILALLLFPVLAMMPITAPVFLLLRWLYRKVFPDPLEKPREAYARYQHFAARQE